MSRVLLKLYWLTVKAAIRSLGRKFLTVRGAILSSVTCLLFAGLGVQFIFMIFMRSRIAVLNPELSKHVADLLPLGMLAYFVASVTPSLGERAIQFSPSEIDFLFPAPFTRRQLLAFFLLRGLVAKLGLSIVLAISLSVLFPSFLSAFGGIFLALTFLHGATIAAQLVQQTIGTQLYSRARKILVAVVVVAAGIGVARAMPTGTDAWTFLAEFGSSSAVKLVTAPFNAFCQVIVAPQLFPHAIPQLAIALAITTAVYGLVFSLDSRYDDMAVRASQRRYERLQVARRGNIYSATSSRTEYRSSLVPHFPWWHGVGPNLRRQFVGGLRDMRHMIWLGLVVAVVFAGVMIFVLRENPQALNKVGYLVLGATAYVTFILAGQLPFGFRGDLNHMEVLKALPVGPFTVATSEVVGAAIIACFGQVFFVVVALLGAPSQAPILLTGAAFFLPYNLLLFGVNDLLLLLFPFRLASSGPDVTLMGRMLIVMFSNLLTVALGFGLAAIPAGVVYFLTSSWIAAFSVAWITALILGVVPLFAVAWAFQRFDLSSDLVD